MNKVQLVNAQLQRAAAADPRENKRFFKTGAGQYAEHDRFIGVSITAIRKIAKQFPDLSLAEIKQLLQSPVNEVRQFALIILVNRYQRSNDSVKRCVYQFYLRNFKYVNNWNLIDCSAHLIVGDYLLGSDRSILLTLAGSPVLWERRLAIVATWCFIKHSDLEWTFKIAAMLLNDPEDLIHKVTGWMLREAGKKDQSQLTRFLDLHAPRMPRTMLRYAIEKFPPELGKFYLNKDKLRSRLKTNNDSR